MTASISLRDDARTTSQLVSAALTEADDDAAWDAVAALHWRGTQDVLQTSLSLCRSRSPKERCLGADILGQLGVPERAFPRQCAAALLDLLQTEDNPDVLQSIFVAFGHLHDACAIGPASRYLYHLDAEVRYAVALALTGHDDPMAIHGLIALAYDAEPSVREWATYALGAQWERDSPEIRHTLVARLDDSDPYVRGEAIVGLARRGDPRAATALKSELASGSITDLTVDAAELIGDASLLEQARAMLAT